jgi:trk system potassium uptake protein TrkA
MSETTASPQNIVILGCGRVGSTLARQFYLEGHSVTIVDLTSDAFRRLGTGFKGQRVVGTGLDQDTLRKAGVDKADVFIAVTPGDNTNIMAAQIAQTVFSVRKVIARIYDPIRAEAYREIGIDTFCTTTLAASLIHASALNAPLPTEGKDASWQSTVESWNRMYLQQVG